MDIPGELVAIVLFIVIGLTIVGLPLARALARRMDRESALPKVPPEVMQRLERMEHAIESIAIEVERISEGQRFTTKLLSERVKESADLPAPSGERG
jgi:orotate phosphoribosyltransferase